MIRVYVTCDVDPDGANTTDDRTRLSWAGLAELPSILRTLAARRIPLTAFVRCDNQIRDAYGDYAAVLKAHRSTWHAIVDGGGEIGWHPHLNQQADGKYVPLRNPQQCCTILREAWEAIQSEAFHIRCARMGEAWHCSETMRAFDELGLAIDSTAVPGRIRQDTVRSFDWSVTPNHPYHPSYSDYRLPGRADALNILEVPLTTIPVKADYDSAPLLRYLDPTYHPKIFRPAVEAYLSRLAKTTDHHLTLIFHPDETLERSANGLHAYGKAAFEENLDTLATALAACDQQTRYCRLSEAPA